MYIYISYTYLYIYIYIYIYIYVRYIYISYKHYLPVCSLAYFLDNVIELKFLILMKYNLSVISSMESIFYVGSKSHCWERDLRWWYRKTLSSSPSMDTLNLYLHM